MRSSLCKLLLPDSSSITIHNNEEKIFMTKLAIDKLDMGSGRAYANKFSNLYYIGVGPR
jgi:hypothetical protein